MLHISGLFEPVSSSTFNCFLQKTIKKADKFQFCVSNVYIFTALSEEDAGSAGEQPASNKIVKGKSSEFSRLLRLFLSFFQPWQQKKIRVSRCCIVHATFLGYCIKCLSCSHFSLGVIFPNNPCILIWL